MQIVLRYLPQALIVIALAVIVVIVVRKLPKTAKLEAEFAAQKAAENAAGKVTPKKRAKLPILEKVGPGLKVVGRGLSKGGRKLKEMVVRGRLKEVLRIAARSAAKRYGLRVQVGCKVQH